jgi:hypothetical protein
MVRKCEYDRIAGDESQQEGQHLAYLSVEESTQNEQYRGYQNTQGDFLVHE